MLDRRDFLKSVSTIAVLASSPVMAGINNPGSASSGSTQIPLLGNLVFKLSADSLALTNGANVTSWTDSQNGIVAGTVVGTGPTFQTNVLGTKPSVRFGGAGSLNIATPGALQTAVDSQTYTVMIVCKTLSGGGIGSFNTVFAASAGGNSFMFYSDTANAGRYDGTGAPPTSTYNGSSPFSMGNISNGAAAVSIVLEQQCLNGTSYYTTVTGLAPGSGGNTFTLGARGTLFQWHGDLFEVLVWNVALTPAQYMQAEKWWRDKYALAYPWASITKMPVFFGDSIMGGVGASSSGGGVTPVVSASPFLAAQTNLGLTWGQYQSLGIGGLTMNQMITLAPNYVNPIVDQLGGKKIGVMCFEWANQRDSTQTAGASMLAALKAKALVQTVFGTSTSASLYDPAAARATFDSAWDAAHTTNIDAYMAIHTDTHIGVDGSYAANSSAGDGLHLPNATQPFLAALLSAGFTALPA